MSSHSALTVRPGLVTLLEKKFPMLWRFARPDGLQELRLVEWSCRDMSRKDRNQAARRTLAWLDYDLGYRTKPPRQPRPTFSPSCELMRGTWFDQIDRALEVERAA